MKVMKFMEPEFPANHEIHDFMKSEFPADHGILDVDIN